MTMLDLTVVLPDGRAEPVRLPGDAPSTHVAEHTAAGLGVAGRADHRWVFVRVATGEPLDPNESLAAFGLVADEALQLALQPHTAAPPPAPSAAAPAPAAAPTAEPTAAAEQAAPPGHWRSSTVLAIAAAAALCAAIVIGAVVIGAVVVLTGDDAPAPAAQAEQARSDADDPDDSPNPPSATPKNPAGVGATPLEPASDATSYAVSLPASWRRDSVDELQSSTAGVTRTRTKLVAPTGGTTLVIDDLVGFDVPAERNRATLDASYAATVGGYRRVAFATRELSQTTGYEWRYVRPDDAGRSRRFANVMFDLGDHAFAVLVSGAPTVPFDELSLLARRVARTVSPG